MFENFDLGNLTKAFEEVQKKAKEIQEKSEKKEFVAKAGGGIIEVKANGKGEIIDIEIDDALLEDKESLQILLISAINDCLKMVEEEKKNMAFSLVGAANIFGK
jgi:DNA-binding YbaB/EbfC family protein